MGQLTLFSNMIAKANNPLKRNAQTNQDPLQKLLLCSDGELLRRLPLLCMANRVRRAALCLKGLSKLPSSTERLCYIYVGRICVHLLFSFSHNSCHTSTHKCVPHVDAT